MKRQQSGRKLHGKGSNGKAPDFPGALQRRRPPVGHFPAAIWPVMFFEHHDSQIVETERRRGSADRERHQARVVAGVVPISGT